MEKLLPSSYNHEYTSRVDVDAARIALTERAQWGEDLNSDDELTRLHAQFQIIGIVERDFSIVAGVRDPNIETTYENIPPFVIYDPAPIIHEIFDIIDKKNELSEEKLKKAREKIVQTKTLVQVRIEGKTPRNHIRFESADEFIGSIPPIYKRAAENIQKGNIITKNQQKGRRI